jgi:ABC-type transporter lipoprotein component MlaA
VLGPNNARSLAGRVGDAATGYSVLGDLYPGYFAGINLNRYARLRDSRGLLEASVDPYLATRSAFAQLDTRCGEPW